MTGQPVVEYVGVHRWFPPHVHALEGVDWRVEEGQVAGLLGPNGAGKSTLLRMAVALLQPHAGTVRVWGRDPWADLGVRRDMGYLADTDAWPPGTRVRDVMELYRSVYPAWDDTLAERYQRRFELPSATKIAALSKGQQRQVGLIATVAHRPKLLVLDEPAGGLDPLVRRDFLSVLVQTVADSGGTVILSSHLVGELERVATHIGLLIRGQMVFYDAVERCVERHVQIRIPHAAFRPSGLSEEGAVEKGIALGARLNAAATLRDDDLWMYTLAVPPSDAPGLLAAAGWDGPAEIRTLGLEDVFIARAGGRI